MCPPAPRPHASPQVHTTPLVGVWVKGPDSPLHPLVAAACIKFFYSSTLLDRALQEDGSFLLLLCPEGESGPAPQLVPALFTQLNICALDAATPVPRQTQDRKASLNQRPPRCAHRPACQPVLRGAPN